VFRIEPNRDRSVWFSQRVFFLAILPKSQNHSECFVILGVRTSEVKVSQ